MTKNNIRDTCRQPFSLESRAKNRKKHRGPYQGRLLVEPLEDPWLLSAYPTGSLGTRSDHWCLVDESPLVRLNSQTYIRPSDFVSATLDKDLLRSLLDTT